MLQVGDFSAEPYAHRLSGLRKQYESVMDDLFNQIVKRSPPTASWTPPKSRIDDVGIFLPAGQSPPGLTRRGLRR
jgi:hypothetical protein